MNYLLLIGRVDVLARIYQRVIVPPAVFDELTALGAPIIVRDWLLKKLRGSISTTASSFPTGRWTIWVEASAMQFALAQLLRADRLIVDEGAARREAARRRIPIIGMLGILLEASRRDLLRLPETLNDLKSTSFHVSKELIAHLIEIDLSRAR